MSYLLSIIKRQVNNVLWLEATDVNSFDQFPTKFTSTWSADDVDGNIFELAV